MSVSIDHTKSVVSEPVPELAAETVIDRVHDCPPRVIANEAVPAAVGVPVIAKVALPAPEANVAAVNVAVSPVTPVDAIAEPVEYAVPLPPVYGTVAVPVYAMFAVAIVENVADEQPKVVMLADEDVTSESSHEKKSNATLKPKPTKAVFKFILNNYWFKYYL
jgi:hypothetical protein